MEHDFLGCSSGKFPGAMFQIPVREWNGSVWEASKNMGYD